MKLIVSDLALIHLGLSAAQLQAVGVDLECRIAQDLFSMSIDDGDCVLLDADAGSAVVLEQIEIIHSKSVDAKILVGMSSHFLDAVVYLKHGVVGLFKQFVHAEQFRDAVEKIQSGHYFLDHDIAQLLAMRQIKKLLLPFECLTAREYDVFCTLAEGGSLQSVAATMGVTSKTVSNCQSQIKAKLGLDTREQMIDFAKIHGLIE